MVFNDPETKQIYVFGGFQKNTNARRGKSESDLFELNITWENSVPTKINMKIKKSDVFENSYHFAQGLPNKLYDSENGEWQFLDENGNFIKLNTTTLKATAIKLRQQKDNIN